MSKHLPLCLTCIAIVVATGCGPARSPNSSGASAGGSGETIKLQGSGASFPAPLYGRWFKEYSAATAGVKVDYQAKGSGGGIKDFIEHTVDFAASDAAMNDDEISQVDQGVVLLPMTAGSIVLSYNLPELSKPLKLSRVAYSKIFLGQISNWNDPEIAKTNEGVKLPDLPITVVRRADSSGTTFVFTNHLSEINQEFADGPGTGKSVNWPESDKFIAAPKNDGVTATIMQTPGAIGYIEYGFAQQAKLAMADLENASGNFVSPTLDNAKAALAGVKMPADMRAWLPDPKGDQAYPIVSYTWLLCYEKYDDPQQAQALSDLVRWCLTEGQKSSAEMGYVPLPEIVVEAVTRKLDSIQ
ncbi:phosphate ABC transporter substrate-binding protein PstS [Novipirellula artificiosorum]|uniref:Phosphate-binding protein n=1 Tax=Novipirellula artificiosorum TaxID=2528016 RepID=A0A5C6DHK5_9BACT|nr:phosphate ABC transporter substrate-binding protein PstS [Novipirellula artificiosorum]TWU36138.1 Phosphate-binding protein PstS precursor [Novipirellula artificiosorum]